jgi:hypothetical protein
MSLILKVLCLVSFLTIQFPLRAEIETFTIKWTSMLCLQSCNELLYSEFLKMPSVADVIMDPGAGTAIIRWKPEAPFTYAAIGAVMSKVGLAIQDMRVKVRGTIIPGPNPILVSLGDQTQFVLLGPIEPSRTDFTITANPQAHALSPQLREQLTQAGNEQKMVIIEGPIFEPERSPPLKMIVQNIQIINPPR